MHYTPFELVFGKQANEIEALKTSISPVYNIDNYVKIMKYTLQKCYERAKQFIENSKIRNRMHYDRNTHILDVNIDDYILVKKEPYEKFKPVYAGPYKVKQIDGTNIVIEINNKKYTIHKNRVVKA